MVVWVANNLNAKFVLKTGERHGAGVSTLHWQCTHSCMQACVPRSAAHHGASRVCCCCPSHADDDAYVDCERLIAELRSRCRNPDCRNERLYMGEEKRNGDVILDAVSSEPDSPGELLLLAPLRALHWCPPAVCAPAARACTAANLAVPRSACRATSGATWSTGSTRG